VDRSGSPGTGFVPGRHLIDAYGRGGFRFAGMSHRGSILALPSGVRAWPVASPLDLGPDSFDAVFAEEPRLEFLILGLGPDIAIVPAAIRARFLDAKIGLDAMTTSAAARTYNVLVAESRHVGAALIAVK
jgi:uncharacterized protein